MHRSAAFSSFFASSLRSVALGSGIDPAAPDVVRRPDPGVGRGVWEAPAWLFWAVAAGAVLVAALYGAHRLGWVKLDRLGRRRKEAAAPPRSSRTSIAPPSGGRR